MRLRGTLGLAGTGVGARVLAADDARLGARTLRSEELGLVARPDHLVRLPHGPWYPSSRSRALAACTARTSSSWAPSGCWSRRASASGRPTGWWSSPAGAERRVPFGRDLEEYVLCVARRMRAHLREGLEPGKRWLGARCRACEYHGRCWGGRR